MFSLEKGSNTQGALSVGIVLSLFFTWYTISADIGIMFLDATFSGISLAVNEFIYWIVILCSLGILGLTFSQEQGESKKFLLGCLSVVNLAVNFIGQFFILPGSFESSTHFGYYIFLGCSIAHIVIGYKSLAPNKSTAIEDVNSNDGTE